MIGRANDSRRALLAIAALIVLLAALCSRYFFQLMLIQGESMAPAYHSWQLVVLDRQARDWHAGDVVAFRCEGLDAVLVKRVVAGPGDTAQIVDGALIVNGERSRVYGDAVAFDFAGLLSDPVELGTDEYIVIGDNVAESRDSRYPEVGVVRGESIVGRVMGERR